MLSRRSLSGDRDSARAKVEPMAPTHHPNWREGSTTALGGMTGAGADVEWSESDTPASSRCPVPRGERAQVRSRYWPSLWLQGVGGGQNLRAMWPSVALLPWWWA